MLRIGFKKFLLGFWKRSGNWVTMAILSARFLSFFASWIALKLLPLHSLGNIIFSLSIVSFLIPVAGLGASQGLLRFGALQDDIDQKNSLFQYVIRKGLLISLGLSIVIIALSGVLTIKMPEAQPYLIGLSVLLGTQFLLESLKIYFRILHQNKKFAQIDLLYGILLILMVAMGCYFFKEVGYIFALILTPLMTFLFFLPKHLITFSKTKMRSSIGFWKYSLFSGMSNTVAQLLIIIDIFLIGFLTENSLNITLYKYLSLIPFSLLILPNIIVTTDFVKLTENIRDKEFMKHYLTNYFFLFSMITLLIWLVFGFWTEDVLGFFGENFVDQKIVFFYLLLGVSSVLLFRGLFGNLLSAQGNAHINFWISSLAILLNLALNFWLIPTYGILGAAMTTASVMWSSSLASVLLYFICQKKEFETV